MAYQVAQIYFVYHEFYVGIEAVSSTRFCRFFLLFFLLSFLFSVRVSRHCYHCGKCSFRCCALFGCPLLLHTFLRIAMNQNVYTCAASYNKMYELSFFYKICGDKNENCTHTLVTIKIWKKKVTRKHDDD